MISARKFAAFLLALVICGSPALACLAPGADLTPAERDCCEQMAQQCGQMDNMPASHSCCRTNIEQPNAMILAKQSVLPPVALGLVTVLEVTATPELSREAVWISFHAPPESPPAQISVLRI